MAETALPKRDADVLVLPLPEPSIDHSPHLWKYVPPLFNSSQVFTLLTLLLSVANIGSSRLISCRSTLDRRVACSVFSMSMRDCSSPSPSSSVACCATTLPKLEIEWSDFQTTTSGPSLCFFSGCIPGNLMTEKSPLVTSIFRSLKRNCPFKPHEAQLPEPKKKGASSSARLLFSSYIFADKIQAPWFKNHIHNQLIAAATSVPCPLLTVGDIRYVYASTPDDEEGGSLLRLCCLAMSCGPNLDSLLEDPEFLELCFEVKAFGVRVLKRCKTRMTAPAAAPKPKGRKRG
ncbi:hypothetical protein EMPG_15807 [Blastomyces silverae]|uniref:Uncharacterized protein n=1 Tax=Blastomyces silverae TaxID=2060906 RepID=A0A0H1BCI6_9EURO|nr:hypothetical protein EMPG_15807 [Blastomyces silverae]